MDQRADVPGNHGLMQKPEMVKKTMSKHCSSKYFITGMAEVLMKRKEYRQIDRADSWNCKSEGHWEKKIESLRPVRFRKMLER